MGVSISQWRSCIGLFRGARCSSRDYFLSCSILAFMYIYLLLLLAGDIEEHPGPLTGIFFFICLNPITGRVKNIKTGRVDEIYPPCTRSIVLPKIYLIGTQQ